MKGSSEGAPEPRIDQIAVKMACSIATRAFLPQRRASSRLSVSARKVPRLAVVDNRWCCGPEGRFQ